MRDERFVAAGWAWPTPSGSITDPSGLAVPNAQITLESATEKASGHRGLE